MSVLVDFQIEDLCLDAKLVVPYKPEMLNPASVDVVIGKTAKIESLSREDVGYLKPYWKDIDLSSYSEDNPLLIQPKEFLLACTEEVFNIPEFLTAEFRLKSSRAREGWNNCLAVFADPGWHGSTLTLELVNECRYHSLPLYPGLKIGQMVFHTCERPKKSYAVTGRYNNDATVMGSKG